MIAVDRTQRWVALLRAVNVGGRGVLAMADLRATATTLGWREAATILQSGSLVFSAAGEAAGLESRLEAALAQTLRLDTRVMVRSAAQWRALVAGNPFAEAAQADPARLVLMVLKEASASPDLDALPCDQERIALAGDAAYVTYPDGIGRSRLTAAVLERRLGVAGTGRNWNSVLKIAAALGL